MSLGMAFARRRMALANRKPKNVWAVYTIGKAIDESADGTSGSFSLSSSRYKMAASSYTVSSSGTVTLTNATQKTATQIAVGDYLVNVSTSNNTSTTGTTLYKVTSVSGSTSRRINYTAYTPVDAIGSDTGNRVEGAPLAYPNDGAYNGYWYVLIRGETTIHVWDIYSVTSVDNWVTVTTANQTCAFSGDSATVIYGSSITESGKNIRISSQSRTTYSSFGFSSSYYWVDNTNNTTAYKGGTKRSSTSSSMRYVDGATMYTRQNNPIKQKGTATGNTETSAARGMYPTDGVKDSYWYTYSHSYVGYIDLT